MKSFTKPMPSNTPVAGSGDHVGDHAKLVDAINELRAGIPNQPSEVNAAPSSILNGAGKVLDAYLVSSFVKTINGISPDSNGNVVVTVNGGYDGSDAVKLSGAQTIAGAKTFTTAPLSSVDASSSNELVRKSQLDLKANASATVNTSGDQTVAGIKTFSAPPVSTSAASAANQLVRKNELDLKADASSLTTKADISSVVNLTTAQTVAGVKTFSVPPVSASTASSDAQLINFGQVKSLIPGQGTPSTLLAAQNWDSAANGTVPDYDLNVVPNGNSTGASVTVQSGALRFTAPTASGNVNRQFWYSDTPAADADITLTFWWGGNGTNTQAWFVYRWDGSSIDRASGMQIKLDFSNNVINAGRAVNGVYNNYSSFGGDKAFTFTANAKYKLRTLLVGQRVRFKLWLASSSEPAAWTFDYVDPTSFAGNPANIGLLVGGSANGQVFVDDLSWYTPASGVTYIQTVNNIVPDSTGNVIINASSAVSIRSSSSVTDTLNINDAGDAIDYTSSSAVTVTIPTDGSVPLPIGTVVELAQIGTGQVTLSPASGVTLQTSSTLKTRTQFSVVTLRKRGTNTWLVSGDLA